MRLDPRTSRPYPVGQAEAAREAGLKALATDGQATEADLQATDGRKHIEDMLTDYQQLVDQLSAGKPIFGEGVTKEAIIAQMTYIQTRLKTWGLKVQFGRRARAELERTSTRGFLTGGPAQAD